MKKVISSLVIVSYLSISITSLAYPMDINNHWAKKQIIELSNENIMHYSSNKFRPEDYITRAELMNAINNTFGFNNLANINFKDVSAKNWYYNDIRKAISAKYIEGYQDGCMRPNNTVSREEAAKFIALACGLDKEIPSSLSQFNDSRDISNWAIVYVSLLNEAGYMNGHDDGSFKPKEAMRRGEIAAILYNIKSDFNNGVKIYHDIYDYDLNKGYSNPNHIYNVQVGYFSNYNAAMEMINYLIFNGFEDANIDSSKNPNMYTVLASPSNLSFKDAQVLQINLSQLGLDSFITKDFNKTKYQYEKIENKIQKPSPNKGSFSVQVGVFSNLNTAMEIKKSLHSKGFKSSYILKFQNNKNYYVMAKSNISNTESNQLKNLLKTAGFEGFITNKALTNITIY